MTRIDETINSWTLRGTLVGAAVAIAALVAGPHDAMAQAPIVYPSQGQSMEQQGADEGQCRMFAQQNTGFNPSQGPQQTSTSSQGGEMVGGAARGAALGAIGGAIGGNAGKGAAIGAGVGAAGGLMRRNRKKRDNQQAQQQSINQYNQQLATYNRAFAACMSGRGYAVN
jgi:hypothetical protein